MWRCQGRTSKPGRKFGVAESLGQAVESDVAKQVNAQYGELLRGPRNVPLPVSEGATTPVSSLEGQRLLGESIRALREQHVEYVHLAARHLMQVGFDPPHLLLPSFPLVFYCIVFNPLFLLPCFSWWGLSCFLIPLFLGAGGGAFCHSSAVSFL